MEKKDTYKTTGTQEITHSSVDEVMAFGNMYRADTERPAILLHSCCGPCSTSVIERLNEKYRITVLFYNPNITDKGEYIIRRDTQMEFIKKYNEKCFADKKIDFIEGDYRPEEFFEAVKGLENEPEGGNRCDVCFRMRLAYTAQKAKELGFDTFATTLTVSPHKNYDLISIIGLDVAQQYDVSFLDLDFKKKAGYQRSIELSKEYGLYRQHYCGCVFSMPKQGN